MATFHSYMNSPSTNDRLMIFVSTGSSGLMVSFSTLVGSASNSEDFEGMVIMIFSTSSPVSAVKLSKGLQVFCQEGLNLG